MTRKQIAARLVRWLAGLVGLCLVLMAFFAIRLGLDNDPGWGRGRFALLFAGLGCWLLAAAFWRRWTAGPRRWWVQMGQSALAARWRQVREHVMSRAARLPGREKARSVFQQDSRLFSLIGAGITLFVYLWFVSNGALVRWTPYSAYYDRLGQAFLAGQVALLEAPSPALLALENPYDWHSRETVPYLWDASLYRGKYYLYWGPLPGVAAALGRAITGSVVEDQALVFLFACITALAFARLLAMLRKHAFPLAPAWTLLPLTLLGGLAIPALWIVTLPGVYEAAIAGGQCCMVLGLLAACAWLWEGRKPAWLAMAGLAWGGAMACRVSLAASVGVWVLAAAVLVVRQRGFSRRAAAPLSALGLPLLLCVLALGAYNAARFGDPLETGHRYQLTGPALPQEYEQVTSLAYLPPNLYNYLIRPLSANRQGPYPFSAPFLTQYTWPFWLRLPPNYYYSEPVAGLPAAVPAFWLALLPGLSLLRRFGCWLDARAAAPWRASVPVLVVIVLAAGALAQFAPLLVFIASTMRYLADVSWILALLAAAGWWWGLDFFRQRPGMRALLSVLAVGLIGLSLLFSLSANAETRYRRPQSSQLPARVSQCSPLLPAPPQRAPDRWRVPEDSPYHRWTRQTG